MKIAFVTGKFPCLSETFILNQITGLIDRGHQVEIVAFFNPGEGKTHPDVDKYRLMEKTRYFGIPGNRRWRVLKAVYLLLANFHKGPVKVMKSLNFFRFGKDALSLYPLYALVPFLGKDFDIIQCHFGQNGNFVVRLKNIFTGGKLVTTFHGHDIRYGIGEGGQVYNGLFKSGDLILACSDYSYGHLLSFGSDPAKTMMHPAGIDIKKYAFQPKTLSGPPGDVTLLSVARLVKEKGLEYGIETVYLLKKKKPLLKMQYLIIGGGPLEKKLRELCAQLDISENVRFLGWMNQDEVIEKMREADIFLLPSIAEANPVVLMEARATGLPVVATSVGSIPEVIADGLSGFLVPPGDPGALAERLGCLTGNPALRREMGRQGRKFVEEKHDIDKLNRRLVEIYEALLSGETGALK